MRETILFSTTKNWNIGDEIILMGLENLFKEINLDYNSVIYNRNPQITKDLDFLNIFKSKNIMSKLDKYKISLFIRFVLNSFFDIYHLDDSFHIKHMNKKWIDKIIFAGTPEWYSVRLKKLYSYAIKNDIPFYFIGIGVHSNLQRLKKSKSKYFIDLEDLIRKAKLIVLRNNVEDIFNYFKSLNENTYYLGCPALFAYKGEIDYKYEEKKEVTFVLSFPDSPFGHKIDENVFKYVVNLIKLFYKNEYKINYILHYIDDFYLIKTKYKKLLCYCNNGDVYYSHNLSDYIDFYKKSTVIISTRVHGNGLASSLGIPNYNIPHDERSNTVLSFGSKILSRDPYVDFNKIIDDDFDRFSKGLVKFKKNKKEQFLKVLKRYFK